MAGGLGSDYYAVNSTGDKVTEVVDTSANRDTIESSLTNYTLATNFEDLVLGTGAVNGTGNNAGNEITGNGAANLLTGGGGNDVLSGGFGADTLKGGTQDDVLEGGFGADVIHMDAGLDQIVYDALNDPADLAALGGDIIIGFKQVEDDLNLGQLLFSLGLNDVASAAHADGSLLLTASGDDTLLQIDLDKGGAGVAVTLATFVDTTLTADVFIN